MLRIIGTCLVAAVSCPILHAYEPPGTADAKKMSAAVRKTAQEVGDATLKGDYGTLVDRTWDGVVKLIGGREKMIALVEMGLKRLKDQGVVMKAYQVGEPGEFQTEGSNTFAVVPTRLEMTIPDGKAVAKSYLLAVSPDGGKTWKFVDGAGMNNKEFRDKGLPKLPAKLKLPKIEKPEVIKD
jgi:hypothetical protein